MQLNLQRPSRAAPPTAPQLSNVASFCLNWPHTSMFGLAERTMYITLYVCVRLNNEEVYVVATSYIFLRLIYLN